MIPVVGLLIGIALITAYTRQNRRAGAYLLHLGKTPRLGSLITGMFSLFAVLALVLLVAEGQPGWAIYLAMFVSWAVASHISSRRTGLAEGGLVYNLAGTSVLVPWSKIESWEWEGDTSLVLTAKRRGSLFRGFRPRPYTCRISYEADQRGEIAKILTERLTK